MAAKPRTAMIAAQVATKTTAQLMRREKTLARWCREAGMCAGSTIRAMVAERDAIRAELKERKR